MSSVMQSTSDARRRLYEWFASTPGRLVLEAELEQLNRILPNLFGYYVVQVGRLSPVDMLSHTRVLNAFIVEIDRNLSECPYPRVLGTPSALPVGSDSVDVVLLPHVLEFEQNPHQALREAQRALVPEGSVLISGFNPWSMLGLSRLALRRRGLAPWTGHFLGLNRVKDWLALLGFKVTGIETYFFRPPLRSERLMSRLRSMESLGARAWPYLAGAYLLTAKKKVTPLTPIRPRWSARRGLVNVGLAEPSARGAIHGAGIHV
ncbi:MAG: methyltransferase domain-containing protein [Gammaproteobacteria bacterium]|nr:methyltransferase domain-containing protein [Gammaproteobacteria bacterium]NIR82861.1 methyltransferase domain-containing protein [Gammaproteobacteria bacterium]NIR89970.1 methyltransferase domain-containing protein [Gammaproteobacteria bacterium]NIU04019.1 methyltransferase domain-containing protein [Gammaproteobacteria bacterium]NIV51339.1 methyltransferase domain-containing protein [Gammaproteobacteria bacterium]